ncbi:MAG: putative capsular polysaccharide synthesis family protein [Pseudomonadota bacterium]
MIKLGNGLASQRATAQPVAGSIKARLKRIYAALEVELVLRHPRGVILFTAAKSGSTTLETTLFYAAVPKIKLHSLLPRSDWDINRWPSLSKMPRNAYVEEAFFRHLQNPNLHRVKIISLVREPISRFLSSCFQPPNSFKFQGLDLQQTLARAHALYVDPPFRMVATKFFDREIEPSLGGSVFDFPFDAQQGYGYAALPRADVLIMRTERLAQLEHVISDFIGRRIKLTRERNVRSETPAAEQYRALRKHFRLSPEQLDALSASRHVQHFFTPQEIEEMRARWCIEPASRFTDAG